MSCIFDFMICLDILWGIGNRSLYFTTEIIYWYKSRHSVCVDFVFSVFVSGEMCIWSCIRIRIDIRSRTRIRVRTYLCIRICIRIRILNRIRYRIVIRFQVREKEYINIRFNKSLLMSWIVVVSVKALLSIWRSEFVLDFVALLCWNIKCVQRSLPSIGERFRIMIVIIILWDIMYHVYGCYNGR